MPFGLAWEITASDAAREELKKRYPHKLSTTIDRAVLRIPDQLTMAWRCYQAGAASALFDLTRFYAEVRLPPPGALRTEVEGLARIALGGKGRTSGQGSRAPLDAHRRALWRRYRHEVMAEILSLGEAYREAEDPEQGDVAWGADPDLFRVFVDKWKSERPDASDILMIAAHLARKQLNEMHVQPRAYYDAFREIEQARTGTGTWPGRFYVPSLSTCDMLDWGFVREMAERLTGSDAPVLHVG